MQTKSRQIFVVLGLLCSNLFSYGNNFQNDSLRRLEVIQAAHTFGQYLEKHRKGKPTNLNPVYSFYRETWNIEKSCPQCPTCGFGVGTWFKMAGLKLPMSNVGLAYNYSKAKSTIRLGKYTTPQKIEAIELGSVNIMRRPNYKNKKVVSYSYHVGLLIAKYPTYGITKEANTSNSGTVSKILPNWYREGEFYKIRPYSSIWKVADWIPEAKAKQDTIFNKKLSKFIQSWQMNCQNWAID